MFVYDVWRVDTVGNIGELQGFLYLPKIFSMGRNIDLGLVLKKGENRNNRMQPKLVSRPVLKRTLFYLFVFF